MFTLFKAASLEFCLFKAAYSLSEELGWGRTAAGRKRLGGLLWEVARAPAGEDAIDRAVDELDAFTRAALPDGLTDSQSGESANWLRSIALGTPYAQWSELERSADLLKKDLGIYWQNWGRLREVVGPDAVQLSAVDGRGGLDKIVRALGARALEKLEAGRSALPGGAVQHLGTSGDWRVDVPHDGAGAAALGHGTSWCTARQPKVHFSNYHVPMMGKFLYVFTNTRDGSRYQAAFAPDGSVEVRDVADEAVDNGLAVQLYGVLKSLGELPKGAEGLERHTHALDLGPIGVQLGRPNTNSEGQPSGGERAPAHRGTDLLTGDETAAWFRDGVLHRESGPAITVDHRPGRLRPGKSQTQIWYRNGVPGRADGGPAMTRSFGSAGAREDTHLEADGRIGRNPEAGPAQIKYNDAGEVIGHSYMRGGQLVPAPSPDTPSSRSADRSTWVNSRGVPHREGGPAVVVDSARSADFNHEEWHINGKKHREGGPAVVGYGGNLAQHWKKGVRVQANGAPYWDDMEAAIDDMRRIKAGVATGPAAGLIQWSDTIERLEGLRDDLLSGQIKGIGKLRVRVGEVVNMAGTFSDAAGRAAAERVLDEFLQAGEKFVP